MRNPHLSNLVWTYWRQLSGELVRPTSLPLTMLKEEPELGHTPAQVAHFLVQRYDITPCLQHVL